MTNHDPAPDMVETYTLDEAHALVRTFPSERLDGTYLKAHFDWTDLLPFGGPIDLRYSIHFDAALDEG